MVGEGGPDMESLMRTASDGSTGDCFLRIWESVQDTIRTEALQDMLLQQLGVGHLFDDVVDSVRGAGRWRLEPSLERIANAESLEQVREYWGMTSRTDTDGKKTTAGRIREETLGDMLLKQLGIRFGVLPDEAVARVRAAAEAQLMGWARSLVTAMTLEQVFSG